VSDEGQRGPLWKFVPMVAHVPRVRRSDAPAGDPRVLPREPGENDLRPLREDGDWRPAVILRRFGGVKKESEHLPRLVIACSVIQGVHKVRELCERLLAQIYIAQPRIQRMVDDDSLERRRDLLKDLIRRILEARQDLPATRARATNDLDRSPDGLREIDLEMLVTHMEAVVLAAECATKRNLTGIDYAAYISKTQPDQRYVEDWLERALGSSTLSGILLFTPPEYGRVVVVFTDGRLAYDPGAKLDNS
jgi:hypothetical protein